LTACPRCGEKYGARELRAHRCTGTQEGSTDDKVPTLR
jgi:hypothetical protein